MTGSFRGSRYMIKLRITASVNPTEDLDKVIKSITNIFGDIPLEFLEDGIMLRANLEGTESVKELRNRIAQYKIRSTINTVLTSWMKEDYLSFGLNRQAAFAGHVSLNLANEDPMGAIQVRVRGNIESFIRFIST